MSRQDARSRRSARARRQAQPRASSAEDPSYRQMLLNAIGQFICFCRLPPVSGRNIRWTTPLLVSVALLMAWDGAQSLQDRFHSARICARGLFPRARATRASSRPFSWSMSNSWRACA